MKRTFLTLACILALVVSVSGCTDLLGIRSGSSGSDIFASGPTGRLIDSPTCQIPGEPGVYENSAHLSHGIVSDVFSGETIDGSACSRKASVTVMNTDKQAGWFVVTYKVDSASVGKMLKTQWQFISPGQTATFVLQFNGLKCGEPVIYNKCVG
ncbi:MAG: hypothetical protein ABIG30_01805 [Candidatus Aenigmatarchaeota archaeon]